MALPRSVSRSITAATSAKRGKLYHASWAAAIALAGVLFAIVYSFATPLFEAPDEIWHFAYVQHLARAQGLPVADPAHPGALAQEATQPPLYYALAAGATFWIDTGDQMAAVQANPHAAVGLASPRGNINLVLPLNRSDTRFRDLVWAVQLARLVSALLAGLTILATYRLLRELWPDRPALAAGSAAITAFTPQFLFIAGSVNNDIAVVAMSALGLWLLARCARRGPSARRWLVLGAVSGLSALAKLGGALFLPMAVAVLLVDGARRRDLRAAMAGPVVVTAAAGLVAGWWYLRNWALYHDPLALDVHLAIVGRRAPTPGLLELIPEFEGLRRSYWAMFGWFNLPGPGWLYSLYDLLCLVGLAGLAVFVLNRVRLGAWGELAALGLLLVWAGLVFAGLVRWTQATWASQGRLIFPAIGAVSALLFLGLAEVVPRRFANGLAAGLGASMALVALALPLAVIQPAYAAPPRLSPSGIATVPNRRDVDFSGQLRLLGSSHGPLDPGTGAPARERVPAVLQDGWLEVDLYWQALAPMERNYSVFVHVVDENEVIVAQEDSYPGRGGLPTSRWPPGVAVADRLAVHIPDLTQAPRMRRVKLGVYDLATGERLRLADGGDHLVLGEVRIDPALPGGRPPAIGADLVAQGVTPVWVDFGGEVALVGYALDRTAATPGDEVRLTLYWLALHPIGRDYTVFTHILGPDNRLLAGDDSAPVDGSRPTSSWVPGEILEDLRTLRLAADAPPGQFVLEVGLFQRQGGRRLRVADSIENRAVLGQVRIIR